jgi:hypothetical protein
MSRKKKAESNLNRLFFEGKIYNLRTHAIFDTIDGQMPNTKINNGMIVYLSRPTLVQLSSWIRNTTMGGIHGWCIAHQENFIVNFKGKPFRIVDIADGGRSIKLHIKVGQDRFAWFPLEAIVTQSQYYKLINEEVHTEVNTMIDQERNITL